MRMARLLGVLGVLLSIAVASVAGAQVTPESSAEACSNGLDDDADGFIDCTDQDCGKLPRCTSQAAARATTPAPSASAAAPGPNASAPAPPAPTPSASAAAPGPSASAPSAIADHPRERHEHDESIGPGHRRKKRGILGLIITGSVMLGLSYIATVTTTAIISEGDAAATGIVAIPLAGPFVLIGVDEGARDGYVAPLAIVGAVQCTSLILLIIGVSVRRPVGYAGRERAVAALPTVVGVGDAGLGLRWALP